MNKIDLIRLRILIAELKQIQAGVIAKLNDQDLRALTDEILGIFKMSEVEVKVIDLNNITDLERTVATLQTIESNAIEAGENIEKVEVGREPETKLNQLEIEALVEEYELAIKNKDHEAKERIEKLIARYEKIKMDEVERFIQKQREIKAQEIQKVDVIDEFVERMGQGKTEEQRSYIKKIIISMSKGEEIPPSAGVNIDQVEVKQIKLKTELFIEKEREKIELRRIEEIKKAFDVVVENATTEKEKQQILAYGKLVTEFYATKTPDLSKYRNGAENVLQDSVPSAGKRQEVFDATESFVKMVHIKDFSGFMERTRGLAKLNKTLLPNIREVRSFEGLIGAVNKEPTVMMGLQKMAYSKIKMIELLGKIPGMSGLSETIGGVAMKEFVLSSMKVMAEQGVLTGGKAILQGIISGTAATAEVAGGSTALASAIAAFQAIPVVGQIILVVAFVVMVGAWLIDQVIKLYDKLSEWASSFGINLWGFRDGFTNLFGNGKFGRFVGTIGQFGFNAIVGGAMAMMAGMTAIIGMGLATMSAMVVPAVIGLTAVSMALGVITNIEISSLVPPPPQGTGGTCWPKGGEEESGKINCRQEPDVPKVSAKMSKDDYADLASRWVDNQGKSHAKECYYDAVNRSLCAGIDPNYTLAIWLHESGASNYDLPTRPDIEDFGIHGSQSVPTENFDLQIKYFLTLDMGPHCPDLPYWLSVSTNFLTGGCDPDLQNDIYPITGRMYYGELQATYNLLTGSSLPATIHVPPGGSQCSGSKDGLPDNEYIRPDGVLMECDGPVDENGNFIGNPGGVDPDSSGKPGEPIPGVSCSVAEFVKSTKQCGESWSNMGLPGGSGTICSAGCGPSSVSSILRPINGGWTPNTIIFETGSPYSNMGGEGSSLGDARNSLIDHGFANKVGQVQSCSTDDVSNWIRQGQAVILLANSYTGSSGGTIGHILVAVGIDDAGVIYTKDPYYSNETPFGGSGAIAGKIKELRQCLPVDLGEPCRNKIK